MKLVSAIITTHNRLSLLKRAIKSVYDQTYPQIELIVVDDGSTDGTEIYCTKQQFTYIRIPTGQSKGGNYARNLGIKSSKGEYVAFLDDDDAWLPQKISKQVELIEQMDCELVHGGRRLEFVEGNSEYYKDQLPSMNHWGDMSRKILLTICTTTTTNILAKREALFEVGLFDESLKFWQEYELTIRLAQRKPFYFVNEPISIYRIDFNDKQRLTNKYYEWRDTVRLIHTKHKDLYQQLNWKERINVQILVWSDAAMRCKTCGLKRLYYGYKSLLMAVSLCRKCCHLILGCIGYFRIKK